MTRQYQIQRIAERPDWSRIEKAPMDQRLWLPCDTISAYAQLAYDDTRLWVRLCAQEREIRAENSDVLGMPCQDSCLEFFLSAAEHDARYLNIELNPNLCLYLGFGTGREDGMRLLPPGGAAALHAACTRSETGWEVTYEIPFALLRLFFPEFRPVGKIRGNFYKCGDLTVQEHYLAWNRVETEAPDFHRPEYFGELYFSV